jgi:hypothetical protein
MWFSSPPVGALQYAVRAGFHGPFTGMAEAKSRKVAGGAITEMPR